MKKTYDFKQHYGPDPTNKPAGDPQCVADDIESEMVASKISWPTVTGSRD